MTLKKVIVIDPGHGGRDRWNVGPTGYVEADGTLFMAKRAQEFLKNMGCPHVYLTRTGDYDLCSKEGLAYTQAKELSLRAAYANRLDADYFVSIHTNAASSPDAHGTETFCYKFGYMGERLAKQIQLATVATLGTVNRGVKEANFAVLRETKMPAALVEVMFHSNPSEERRLKDVRNLALAGDAIAMGTLLSLYMVRVGIK